MRTDVLIVGQGICGTFLSWWLEKAGLSFVVVDEERVHTASRAAAGLINPVTGRRIVKTWMIDELLSFAEGAYRDIGRAWKVEGMRRASVIDFFPTAQMRLAFLQRYEEDPSYLRLPAEEHDWDDVFTYELGYGRIEPCYLVDLPRLLATGRQWMRTQRVLREERFEREELVVTTAEVRYRDIDARWVIFCDGAGSFDNPYFSRLPFAPNKGEALVVDIPGLSAASARDEGGIVFKKGISLAPWKEGLFWVGSSYEWSFTDLGPTEIFRKRTEGALQGWVKLPFTVIEHIASVRPATLERRPFVGFHPLYPAVGILNGMGTKGCSLAPYFAHQLVENITEGRPIRPDVDVRRFTKILSR